MPSRRTVLTLPNVVSMSRIPLAAAFVVARSRDGRVAIVALAAVTDVVDGWLARRGQRATRLGALVDPAADRLFALVVVAVLVSDGALTVGEALTLLLRDVATLIGAVVARAVRGLRAVPLRARWPGKLVTALQSSTLVAAVIAPPRAPWLVPALVTLVGTASVLAIVDYSRHLWRNRLA